MMKQFTVKLFVETNDIEVFSKVFLYLKHDLDVLDNVYSIVLNIYLIFMMYYLQLCDKKTNKCFLKKCPMPSNLSRSDFFVGGKVSIHSRLMAIIDFGDPYTKRKLASMNENATILIGPDAFFDIGKILAHIMESGRCANFIH